MATIALAPLLVPVLFWVPPAQRAVGGHARPLIADCLLSTLEQKEAVYGSLVGEMRKRAQRHSVPRMQEGEKIGQVLAQLDEEVAAYGAVLAEKRKSVQERAAAARAEEQQQPATSGGRVTAFGARLDDDVAGTLTEKDIRTEHERLFAAGNNLMLRGEYKKAVTAFTQATAAAPGGMSNRKGGQYAIYLAQALQAVGRKKEAVGLLKRCEAHPDQDVRKIADSVLYIMQAPELKLDADQFMRIDSLGDVDDWGSSSRKPTQQKDPPPEKYSIEWYMLEAERTRLARESAAPPADQKPALIVGALLLLGTVGAVLAKGG